MSEFKWLHHLDVLMCSNGGVVELPSTVKDRDVFSVYKLRPVCDKDLKGPCYVVNCSIGCKKIISIEIGLAKDTELRGGAVPVIGDLSATTDKGCTVTWKSSLADQLALAEGRSNTMYLDSAVPVRHPTIGIGFNLDRDDAREKIEALGYDFDQVYAGNQSITDADAQSLFAGDQATAESTARSWFPNFDTMSADRQKALTDMAFNMGSWKKFPNFVKAVKAEDWETAAKEAATGSKGKPSDYLTGVKDRARRVIAQLRGDVVFSPPQ
ncbi:MAG: glycoside hydrolase family protein [Minicystis sp.]